MYNIECICSDSPVIVLLLFATDCHDRAQNFYKLSNFHRCFFKHSVSVTSSQGNLVMDSY